MIRIANFAGEIPRLKARLLPENYAQQAENVRVESGDLLPIRASRFEQALTAEAKTIYKHGDVWLGFDEIVNVVPAPIAANRVYIFGDGVPKLLVDGKIYPLAVPLPENAPYAALSPDSPAVDNDNSFVVLYAFTWVTAYDEESMPSDLSNEVTVDSKSIVKLEQFPKRPEGRNIDRLRIYRSQTSASGDTTLYFVTEQPAPDFEGCSVTK